MHHAFGFFIGSLGASASYLFVKAFAIYKYIALYIISFLDGVFALFLFLCYRWSFVHVTPIFSCPADHVPDWQPRIVLGMYACMHVCMYVSSSHIAEYGSTG